MFMLRDDVHYRHSLRPEGPEFLLVEPGHLQTSVSKQLQDPTKGRLGVLRTYDRVWRRFYWPGLHRSLHR